MWTRWRRYAHIARYGNQPLTVMLGGRYPTEWELTLFQHGLDHWLEAESPEGAGDSRPANDDRDD